MTVKEGDFVVIAGPSGSGKTTLLRLIKHELAPYGKRTGAIRYKGKDVSEWDAHTLASEIGYVFQEPDDQIVMDEVLQEIVFGMEHVNLPHLEMRKRLSELVHAFGVDGLLKGKTHHLSGGQKQLVSLLSILLLRPNVLLLDEPTSQLDPVSAKELLQLLERLNREMGITIILVEHRLEELFPLTDNIIFLDEGKIAYSGSIRQVIYDIYARKDARFYQYLPSVSRLYLEKEAEVQIDHIPLHVKEARSWLRRKKMRLKELDQKPLEAKEHIDNPLISLDKVYFQYERESPFILKNCSLAIAEGEFFAIVGGNGSGKSTLLKVMMGLLKPQRGLVRFKGKKLKKYSKDERAKHFGYLPQHPLAYYMEETIGREMEQIIGKKQMEDGDEKKQAICQRLKIGHLLDRHPNDISSGELQRATLACLLLEEPTVLFIDEPTKGLDPDAKERLASLLQELKEEGLTIVMVTHDIEFAVKHVDRCAILFDGAMSAIGTPGQIFKGNYFYTTTINRATYSEHFAGFLTLEEAVDQWENIYGHYPLPLS